MLCTDQRCVICMLHNNDLNQVTWELRAMGGAPKFEESQVLPGEFEPLLSGHATVMPALEHDPDLREILHDLTYPAEKWQITSRADIYGADIRTRRAVYALPTRVYTSLSDITDLLNDGVRAQ